MIYFVSNITIFISVYFLSYSSSPSFSSVIPLCIFFSRLLHLLHSFPLFLVVFLFTVFIFSRLLFRVFTVSIFFSSSSSPAFFSFISFTLLFVLYDVGFLRLLPLLYSISLFASFIYLLYISCFLFLSYQLFFFCRFLLLTIRYYILQLTISLSLYLYLLTFHCLLCSFSHHPFLCFPVYVASHFSSCSYS